MRVRRKRLGGERVYQSFESSCWEHILGGICMASSLTSLVQATALAPDEDIVVDDGMPGHACLSLDGG